MSGWKNAGGLSRQRGAKLWADREAALALLPARIPPSAQIQTLTLTFLQSSTHPSLQLHNQSTPGQNQPKKPSSMTVCHQEAVLNCKKA